MIRNLKKKQILVILLLAFLFTAMQVVGYQLSMHYRTSVHQSEFFLNIGVLSTGGAVLLAIVEYPVWCILLYVLTGLLDKVVPSERSYTPKQMQKIYPAVFFLLFLAWIPAFLAAYPGFYNYDAVNQVPQALYPEVPYNAHHPLIHTLFMGKIIAFGYLQWGTLNAGIALHSLIQMLVSAAVFAYIICFLLKNTGRRLVAVVAFAYYAFFPVIAMFVLSTTKDTIFTLILQLCVMWIYEMFKDMPGFFSSKWKMGRLLAAMVFMCLFRNNGIYIVVCILPFVILLGKYYRKQCALLFLVIIAGYFLLQKALLYGLNATEGSAEEALSVPIQQLTRVYYEHGENAFEEEELDLIYEGISAQELGAYNPFLSDNIKNVFDYRIVQDNKKDFLFLWLKKGMQYPGEYINAFLDNTYQAWYPGTSVYDVPGGDEMYYFAIKMCPGGDKDSKLPGLWDFYNRIATQHYYQRIPVVRLLFSIGAMLWVAIFVCGYAYYRRNKALFVALLVVLFCCCTALLGPISLVRYYLILFFGFPVSIGFLFDKRIE